MESSGAGQPGGALVHVSDLKSERRAPHLFGARRDAFEADLRRLLREASPSGRFSERRPGAEVFVWRAGAAGR